MRPPVLRRFDISVFKAKNPPSDLRQTPALATISFYRQGATVRTATTVAATGQTAIAVYHPGTIAQGDSVQRGADAGTGMIVASVSSDGQTISVTNSSGGPFNLSVGDRLVRTLQRPNIYSDPNGTMALGTSAQTDPNTGQLVGYLREYRFDYVVSGTGVTTEIYADAEGSYAMR